jgi:REP element-mobilizing transposase RayT
VVKKESGEKEFWQRNYYEHIIRNEEALSKIREYIQNNPMADRIRFEEFYK